MTTKRLTLLAIAAAALALPAGATAGGWATVGLDSTPDGLAAGEPWTVELTILQHGRTPLEHVRPEVIVVRDDGGGRRSFRAAPTDEPGVYRASVVFASAGTWRYMVDDDFAATHSYSPVSIGGAETRAAGLGDDGPDYLLALVAAAVAALAVGLVAAGLRRRRAG